MARVLGKFVRVEPPSYNKAAVDRFGRILATEWRRRGAKITLLRQREQGDHIRAEWNQRGSATRGQILVLGHLDTVYDLGTLPPTPFRVSPGRAFGPGPSDITRGC